jgi:hypothetical protein
MKNCLLVLLLLAFFAFPVWVNAAADSTDFHSLIIRSYSFAPSRTSTEERESKSKAMNAFWSFVSSDSATLLPKLRAELERKDNPDFFYYDGAKLLLSLSRETKDKQLAIASIARSDLSEIQPLDYVHTLMIWGAEGVDTSDAAFRVLDYPGFTIMVPAQAFKLQQNYSLILMLYQMPDQLFVNKAVNRLLAEKNIISQKSLLEVLWCSATSLGDETIAKAAADKTVPKEVHDYAAKLLENTGHIAALKTAEIEKFRKLVALDQALLKAAPAMEMSRKGKKMSGEQIDAFKLFMEALNDSGEVDNKKMLEDYAGNSDGFLPEEVSNYAEKLLKGQKQSLSPASRPLSQYDIAELKKLRQTFLSGISGEVMDVFNSITVLIRWTQMNGGAQKK